MNKIIVTGVLCLTTVFSASAVDYTWLGGDGLWKSTSGWDPATGALGPVLTTAGNTATINSGSVSWSGTDFGVQGNNTLTVNAGATWIQNTGTNYINIGNTSGATLNIAGGTFDTNTSTGFFTGSGATPTAINVSAGGTLKIGTTFGLGAGSSINMSGGSTATLKGITINAGSTLGLNNSTMTVGAVGVPVTFAPQATSHINLVGNSTLTVYNSTNVTLPADFVLPSGASFSLLGAATTEVQPAGGVINGGSLSMAGLLAFQGAQVITFSGGNITIGATTNEGIYSSGGIGYINFTLNSTGSLLFTGVGNGEQNIFQNSIRYNGATYTLANYQSVFTVTHPTASQTLITLASVPEPSTFMLMGLGLAAWQWRRRRSV
ncbi:MAG: PEP-CTERM sorting domain-containing protein [Chthoniobacterales bacterium]